MIDRPLLPVSFYHDKETDEVVFVYPEEKTERIPVGEMIERIRPRTLSELLDPYRGVYKLTPKQKAIFIPEGATNGDVIMAVFPDIGEPHFYGMKKYMYDVTWWNAPYKGSEAAEQ